MTGRSIAKRSACPNDDEGLALPSHEKLNMALRDLVDRFDGAPSGLPRVVSGE